MMEPEYYEEVAAAYEDDANFYRGIDDALSQACLAQADKFWFFADYAREKPNADEWDAENEYERVTKTWA